MNYKEFDCDIGILCETNTRRLSHVDVERQVIRRRAQSDLIQLYFERAAEGELRWVLDELVATDEGAHRVGEFGIGANSGIKVFTKNMLFDEKIGGTIHLAVGKGYPETGAANESAIRWDFLRDMTEGRQIMVDGQPFYDSGRILI